MMANISTEGSWFQYWQSKPQAQIRLFCFPYAGGGASIFRSWSKHAHPEINVCPIQLPGRENRLLDEPFSKMHLLIDILASALLPYLDMPYAFFGHSMGALIGFELARYLRQIQCSLDPVHIFVSGHRAPQLPDLDPPMYNLPEQAFIEELRRLKGTSEEVLQNTELLELLIPRLRNDFALVQQYVYRSESKLSCPITAFRGFQDESISRDMMVAWQEQTSDSFRLYCFPGDHFFLHKEHIYILRIIAQELFKIF